MLVRLAEATEVVGFFSSSLALILGWLRCVAVVDEDVGRRVVVPAAAVVDVGGRVGGLLRPVEVRAEVVEAAATGRREEAVAVVAVALGEAVMGARGDAVLLAALLDMMYSAA